MSHALAVAVGSNNPGHWMAEVTYVTDREPAIHVFEEIEDLDQLIERGPDWREIDQIVITLNEYVHPKEEKRDRPPD
jgi:hypothetical protein